MIWRTYKEWNKSGYYVMRGERGRRKINGTVVFSEDQVMEKLDNDWSDYVDYDYDDFSFLNDPWMFD